MLIAMLPMKIVDNRLIYVPVCVNCVPTTTATMIFGKKAKKKTRRVLCSLEKKKDNKKTQLHKAFN